MDFFRSPLVRFLAAHLAVGLVAGWTVLGLLLWLDAAGLRSLIIDSGDAVLAIAMLAIFFALTFGSLAMGTGIMSMNRKSVDDSGPSAREPPVKDARLAPALILSRRKAGRS